MGEARLPGLTRDELGPEGRAVYDAIVASRSPGGRSPFALVEADGSLRGPFNAMVAAPAVGGPLAALGASLRYTGSLSHGCRELAILMVAVHADSDFEWASHVPVALEAGIDDRVLAAVRAGEVPLLDDVEATVAKTVTSLLADGDLSDAEHGAATTALGDAGLVELVVLVGYYRLLAQMLRVFRVDG